MRILVAMSGGVDSSVAAALLAAQGHEVVGATMKLWGGESDSGCCSVSDVEDARRVAAQLGLTHHVFNFTADFEDKVVTPYVDAHAQLRTPNPCIECNRRIKFDRFLHRALRLGFDAVATGHHARTVKSPRGRFELWRGADSAKDQSYVLAMLGQSQLGVLSLPIGEMTKSEVRMQARELGLRTASKPDSQDVCFITSRQGRHAFLEQRIAFTPGRLVDASTGEERGRIDAMELLTVGQRRHLSDGTGRERRYVVSVGPGIARLGDRRAMMVDRVVLEEVTFTDTALATGARVLAQTSAHGVPVSAVFEDDPPALSFPEPSRRVAPGQTIAFYEGDRVLGSAICAGND